MSSDPSTYWNNQIYQLVAVSGDSSDNFDLISNPVEAHPSAVGVKIVISPYTYRQLRSLCDSDERLAEALGNYIDLRITDITEQIVDYGNV